MKTLEETLIDLRIISYTWSDTDKVIDTLKDAKRVLRTAIMTDDLFDLYDSIVLSLDTLEFGDEEDFDGRIFTSVLTKLGFKDFSRDDYTKLKGE